MGTDPDDYCSRCGTLRRFAEAVGPCFEGVPHSWTPCDEVDDG